MTTEEALNKLKPYQDRGYVPAQADLTDLAQIKDIYQKLIDRDISNVQEFEQWILDRSEMESALDQAGSILYIDMTCQTDDEAKAKAYTRFIEVISPAIKPLDDKLNNLFLKHLESFPLDEKRYAVYIRETKVAIELFREENVALGTKVELLSQEYQSICGAMTVEFEGEEQTMPQMSKYLLENDRDLRERAWRASSQRRLQDKEKLDNLFDEMLKLRNKIAANAGFDNFCDYKFKAMCRFDYTPVDCKTYHATVEKHLVPLLDQIYQKRKKDLGVDDLYPWDMSVDPLGQEPLKPFKNVKELISGCEEMFTKVDPELGSQFKDMADRGLLDLENRKGKAPGGYQNTLNEARKPFIFMNSVGVDSDVYTLLHEGGHAFHAIACADDPLVDYRHGPMEFCEVASMAMELLAGEYLSTFYNKEDEIRSKQEHFEDIIFTLVWVANIDCFQHWIYENPTHTAQERREQWLLIRKRFSSNSTNWEGFEEELAYMWHRQLHIFEVPFYYIEYGIAQLGALQVWQNAKTDWSKALADYRKGLSVGGAIPLPDIYTEAGIKFDFSEETIVPLANAVKAELSLS